MYTSFYGRLRMVAHQTAQMDELAGLLKPPYSEHFILWSRLSNKFTP